ncbi:hypothetical protein [Bradyrhizobium sp. SBR1B]|uniref:hypothetical protein n=1 Tax=Bradyrhizobium sp. SBR1B TaxID=2663836 RepID=UPI0016056C32|nr:hypothetical protein [Bradyrhizobium sp. SBR1B]MBB4381755.1 ABC-type transporter Mla subunit MlaD [Bradyrhizobium sp. SBR1B]
MDRAMLERHLGIAERHAAQGREHLDRQEQLIAELDRNGHDTAEAIRVLTTLRQTQTLHEQDVERLLNELEN